MANEKNKTAKIRELNDLLRTTFGAEGGRVVLTRGIAALEKRVLGEVIAAIQEFDEWGENDPHGEHDFVAVQVQGHSIFAKIDYFDLDHEMHSPDPSEPAVTRRLMTVMLAEEY